MDALSYFFANFATMEFRTIVHIPRPAFELMPCERIIFVAYYTVLDSPVTVKGQDDAAQAGWFLLSDLPCLAFDHAEILKEAERLMEGRATAGTAF